MRQSRAARPRAALTATAFTATVGIGALGLGAAACSSSGGPAAGGGPTTTVAPSGAGSGSATGLEQTYVSVVERVRPQVVEITTSSGIGSGVVFDDRGDIVTNAHVVGSETKMSVTTLAGARLDATLVGVYPPDDLAVIRASGAGRLAAATFGDSKALQVGDIVLAVGNPLGLASSVTDGIVSFNGRPVSEGNGVVLPSTIQTSAAINPGNSGGALVDLQGRVIGIPTLAAVNQQAGGAAAGIGFAIPSDTVKLIAPQLIATGHVTRSGRAALGISGSDAVDASGTPSGALVTSVAAGGAAAAAGLGRGDVITSVNGQPVTSLADLQGILAGLTPGQTAQVTVQTPAGSRTVAVTLGQLAG